MTHTDPEARTLRHERMPTRDTPLRLALRDVRTAAMIVRAYVSRTLHYDDPITAEDVRLLEEAIQMLQHTQRMLDLHDPDVS